MDTRLLRLALAAGPLLVGGCAGGPAQPPEQATTQPAPLMQPAELPAPTPMTLAPDYPQRYVVKRGDTLWSIATRFLRAPWRWPELWQGNPQIVNPHLIYPGDVLTLVYIEGRPTLQVQRGYPTVKLSPQVRVEELDRAIPTIPLDAIEQFLTRPQVLDPQTLETAPYIVSSSQQHLIAGAGYRVYVRALADDGRTDYVVLRRSKDYLDPDTKEMLGVETFFVGDARIEHPGDPAAVQLLRTEREALIGDRLLPPDEDTPGRNFLPKAPGQPVEGRIISLLDSVSQVGQFQVVAINRGRSDALEVGHVLEVRQHSGEVRDVIKGGTVELPPESAGIIMVFRVFDRVSYALVMQATRPIHLLDKVTNPSSGG